MRHRLFLKSNHFSHILSLQISIFHHSFSSLCLRHLTIIITLLLFIVSTFSPWLILFSHQLAILLNSFILLFRLIDFLIFLRQFLQNKRMTMSLIQPIQLLLIRFLLFLLHKLTLQSMFFKQIFIMHVILVKLLNLLLVHRFVHL